MTNYLGDPGFNIKTMQLINMTNYLGDPEFNLLTKLYLPLSRTPNYKTHYSCSRHPILIE